MWLHDPGKYGRLGRDIESTGGNSRSSSNRLSNSNDSAERRNYDSLASDTELEENAAASVVRKEGCAIEG